MASCRWPAAQGMPASLPAPHQNDQTPRGAEAAARSREESLTTRARSEARLLTRQSQGDLGPYEVGVKLWPLACQECFEARRGSTRLAR